MTQQLPPLHLACGDDDMRPNICLIEIKNNIATATEGHILVKIDLTKTSTLEPDQLKILEGKFIHKEVWKEIHKCDHLELDDQYLICHKNGIKKIFEYAVANGEFFNTNSIITDAEIAGNEPKNYICYSPHLIQILYKIFQSEQIIFHFNKGNKGTFVYPAEDSGMFAILMPKECVANRYFFI